jgi:rhodanese-related sulfurtransferase
MFALFMGLRSVSPDGLHQMIQRQEVTVIDVNSPLSWKAAHVPGALNLDHFSFRESDLPADKSSALVFYCSNPMCRKAPIAGRRARRMGFEDVKVMSAGIAGWLASKLPAETGE